VLTTKKAKKCSNLVEKCVRKSYSAKISKPRYVSATRKIIYKNSTTKVRQFNAICVKCSELIIQGLKNAKYSEQIPPTKVSQLNAICAKCSEVIIQGQKITRYSEQIILKLRSHKKKSNKT
jgi:hypothetical protein